MKKTHIVPVVMLLAITILISGCKGDKKVGDTKMEFDGPRTVVTVAKDQEILAVAGLETYINAAENLAGLGDYSAEQGLTVQAESFYSMAQADLASLRFACECILSLRGEEESLEELIEGSSYTDWSSIAALSPSSPYPFYFEGLMYHLQDREEEAVQCWTLAAMYERFPEAGLDLTGLGDMEIKALYTLRDSLRETEDTITARYQAPYLPVARHPYNGSATYLLTVARNYIANEDYETALDYCFAAVNADPYDGNAFAGTALALTSLERFDEAQWYLREGLLIAPEHEGLSILKKLYKEGA